MTMTTRQDPPAAANDAAALSDAVAAESLPTSFGVFKPVGYVMMGLPSQPQADALVHALHEAGWPPAAVLHFTTQESADELQALVDQAGPLAGLGYEITLLRRYVMLARQGYRWLLVKADDTDAAGRAAAIAGGCGATLAVHYRALTVEDLL